MQKRLIDIRFSLFFNRLKTHICDGVRDIVRFERLSYDRQLLQKYVQYVTPAIEVPRSLVNSVFTISIV